MAERFRAPGSKAARVQSGVSGGHDGTWAALVDELQDGMRSNPGRGAVTENFDVDTSENQSVDTFQWCAACFEVVVHAYVTIACIHGMRSPRPAHGAAGRPMGAL